MRRLGLLLAMAATACDGQGGGAEPAVQPTTSPVATASATATPTPTASATATSNGARSVAEDTDDFTFEYAYPLEAGRIPALAALLDRRMTTLRDQLAADSEQARRDARNDGFPYNKHSARVEWSVVTDLPDWLSLSSEVASYSGGAHGNLGYESLIWDKQAGRARDSLALFESPAALDAALGERLCEALDAEREERRGEPVPADSEEPFDQCVGFADATVLLGSSNRRTFNRLTVQIGPYVAGPYAEGAYEFDFPVDAEVLDAVKPEFRGAFTARN